MKITTDFGGIKTSRTYRLLRRLFAAGLALSVILYFVRCYKPGGDVLKAWLATGGVERSLSSFDLCRLLVRTGNVQWGAFYMGLASVEIALLLLALQHPRRWVFVAGSCEQLYLLIAFLLRPSSDDLPLPSVVAFLSYLSWAMCLTGFFVKRPRIREGPRPGDSSSGINEQTTAATKSI